MGRWRTIRRGSVSRFGSNSKGCIAHGEVTIASSTESTQRGIASRSWPSSTDRTLTGRVSSTGHLRRSAGARDRYATPIGSRSRLTALRYAMSSGSLSGPVAPPLAKVTEHGIPNLYGHTAAVSTWWHAPAGDVDYGD